MDTSIFELFTAEEIMKRLTKRAATGALHVFSAKESANIFFAEGMIVAAAKGLMEGEELIKQVLEWTDAHFSWQPEMQAPASLKPMDLHFPEFRAKMKMTPVLENGINGTHGTKPLPERKNDTAGILINLQTRAASTGPLLMTKTETLGTPKEIVKSSALIPVPSALTATKNMSAGVSGDTFEEALMRKHQLALVAVETGQRLRIIRSNNLVGRNPACDFTMNHSSVSRQHCLLQITERGLHVKDLSTTNGTKVNGINLTEGYVSIGDKLTIGHLDFFVEKDDAVGI